MSRAVAALCTAVLAAALTGCGGSSDATDDGRLRIVATTTQVQDFTRQVVGDRATVTGLLRPGVDAHDFDPSPKDLRALGDADVIVQNGIGLEEWLDDTVEASGFDGKVVVATEGVQVRGEDPHVWQDVRNAITMVDTIARDLGAAAPQDAAAFRDSADAYIERLEQLDADIRQAIEALPDKRIVTNHDAFRYYIDAYGLEFVGSVIPSFDSAAELSGKDVDELVARIKETGVRAIFSETSLPADAARTVARSAGVTVVEGEDALYGDSLGPNGTPGATYVGMIEHNTATIVSALSAGARK